MCWRIGKSNNITTCSTRHDAFVLFFRFASFSLSLFILFYIFFYSHFLSSFRSLHLLKKIKNKIRRKYWYFYVMFNFWISISNHLSFRVKERPTRPRPKSKRAAREKVAENNGLHPISTGRTSQKGEPGLLSFDRCRGAMIYQPSIVSRQGN